MNRFGLVFVAILAWTSTATAQTESDPIAPLITFLNQLQRLRELYTAARNDPNSLAPTFATPTLLAQNQGNIVPLPQTLSSFFQSALGNLPISLNSVNSVNNPLQDNSIDLPVQSTSANNNNNNNNNNNEASVTLRFPSFRRNRQGNGVSRVNQGITDILQGVRMADLARILRVPFSFTRNSSVRSVADTVLNNIFPNSPSATTGGAATTIG